MTKKKKKKRIQSPVKALAKCEVNGRKTREMEAERLKGGGGKPMLSSDQPVILRGRVRAGGKMRKKKKKARKNPRCKRNKEAKK